MKYKTNFTSREWEIIAEEFSFDDYYAGKYDDTLRLKLSREAWRGDIPLYLHDVGEFSLELLKLVPGNVTPEPIFSIFDKDNLTFTEMLQEIWKRRREITRDPNSNA